MTVANIVDVTDADFAEKVLDASKERPVVVDFWADWCGPCQILGPVLERLAEEFGGAFLLARVDVEQAPTLARQFQIQSIPLVMLFRDGQPVEQFVGVLPEQQIRNFLKKHCPRESDQLVVFGREKMSDKDWEAAFQHFKRALALEPDHPGALLGMAEVAWKKRNLDEMVRCLEAINPLAPEAEAAAGLKAQARFYQLCQEAGGLETCRKKAQADAKELEARYQYACCLAAEERYRDALQELLQIVSLDREFKDEAPRKIMVEIFNIVGTRSPLADEYRTRLARTIF